MILIQNVSRIKRTSLAVMLVAAGLGMSACHEPEPAGRVNAPPQGVMFKEHPLNQNFVPMTDNAMLNEGTLSPVHFVPRTAELNSLGVRRLTRMADIIRVYGGVVLYDGQEEDLGDKRVDQVERFLLSCGLTRTQFEVKRGLAGGMCMDSNEAVMIRDWSRGPGMEPIPAPFQQFAGSTTGK
jgi:hypothetical protein